MPRNLSYTFFLLPTALVKMFIGEQFLGLVRALCDTGGQANLVEHKAITDCEQELSNTTGTIIGISDTPIRIRKRATLSFLPWFVPNNEQKYSATFYVLPKAAKWAPMLPEYDIPCDELNGQLEPALADPLFWRADPVHLLFGIEVWAEMMCNGATRVNSSLVSQETIFGNLVFGRIGNRCEYAQIEERKDSVHFINTAELDKTLQKFWEFEDLSLCIAEKPEHELIEKMFLETYLRDDDGRFIIKIPLKQHVHEIGSSREMALKRFFMLEKRFQREPSFKEKYVEFMREYEQLGHMIEAKTKPEHNQMSYHIPHHGVMTSNKFRVVFDASCKTNIGISLNEAQYVGPKLQRNLHEIIMRFRRHKIAISADIKKMYRQIKINADQWELQRIFWRERANAPLKEYYLVVVTYGLASSPYVAVRAMHQGAMELKEQFPNAVHAIKEDFYMDDGLTGAETENEAIQLSKDMRFVLQKSGFPLCKWKSNNKKLVHELEGENDTAVVFSEEETSVLGLKWLTMADEFTYEVKAKPLDKLTKRTIFSKIGQLYDPNGFIAPVITSAKLLIQLLWKLNLNWDEIVPQDVARNWESIWNPIKDLEQIRIPRWLNLKKGVSIQIHGFADASKQAYGAVVYLRAIDSNGAISCKLIASKSRIAPIKEVTIPRLELAAADLLSQLMEIVRDSMELKSAPYFLWSDSTITLQWLSKPIHELKLFVANRVKRICQYAEPNRWEHIRTEQNPADLISRGLTTREILNNSLWWNGPEWLSQPQDQWPEPVNWRANEISKEMKLELKTLAISVKRNPIELFVPEQNKSIALLEYSENLSKIVNIHSYVKRFINNCKQKVCVKRIDKERLKQLTIEKIRKEFIEMNVELPTEEEQTLALRDIICKEQALEFPKEYKYLRAKLCEGNEEREFPDNSKILSLRPFMDSEGLIRAEGRLRHANVPFDTKHPVIISPGTRLCHLIIADAHRATKHGAVQIMMQYIRASYWISRLRSEIRAYIHKCVTCARYAKHFGEQLMSELPADRVNQNRAFLITGVDFAGPITITERYKSRTNKNKCWIAIFVCMVTRAVHIDIVTDCTSAAFIACFERFVARRGHCNKMYSDNGTTFVGAEKEIRAAFKEWRAPDSIAHLNRKRTKWVFAKPVAPHQGGIYEAAVKSAKFHLRRVLGAKSYPYEYLLTFLAQVEAILNSRPLSALSDDPNDCQALTPGHFLINEPLVLPPPIATPTQTNYSITRIRAEQQKMLENFWRRWQNEYLTTLLPRKKWLTERDHFQKGQLVVIKDDNRPPSQWLLGKIQELILSNDGLVRAVVIKTAKSTLTRAVQGICLLPLLHDETENETENNNLKSREKAINTFCLNIPNVHMCYTERSIFLKKSSHLSPTTQRNDSEAK